MIRMLCLSILFVLGAHAKTYLIEIADFACKFCLEAEAYTDILRDEVQLNDDKFLFVPLAFRHEIPATEIVYLASREYPEAEQIVRDSAFKVTQEQQLNMTTASEFLDWLQVYEPQFEELINKIEDDLIETSDEQKYLKAYLRGFGLAKEADVKETPTFIIIDEKNNIQTIKRPKNMSISDYIEHTLNTYKRVKNNAH